MKEKADQEAELDAAAEERREDNQPVRSRFTMSNGAFQLKGPSNARSSDWRSGSGRCYMFGMNGHADK